MSLIPNYLKYKSFFSVFLFFNNLLTLSRTLSYFSFSRRFNWC